MQGFTSFPRGAFSAIDTGPASQAADKALLRHLKTMLTTFDFVLLGGTHDGSSYASYVATLPSSQRSKLQLLQTTPALAPAVAALRLPICRFHGIFDGRDPNKGLRHTIQSSEERIKQRVAELAELRTKVT